MSIASQMSFWGLHVSVGVTDWDDFLGCILILYNREYIISVTLCNIVPVLVQNVAFTGMSYLIVGCLC